MPSQSGKITDRCLPSIKKLMLRAIRNMEDCPRKKIVTFTVQRHEPFAALDIDRFLTVRMLPGMTTDWNLSTHQTATAGWKTNFRSDHQRRVEILRCAGPLQIFCF